MERLFESIFSQGDMGVIGFLISIAVSLVIGVLFALVCCYKAKSSKSFYITTALVPACVALVIMLVNGNIGAGIAVAGAFSLVRFRSAPGTAKEIVIIFISTAAGLALGMGYIAYAVVFVALASLVLFLLSKFAIFEKKNADCDKLLKITIPESLDYENVFGDLFTKYTKECKLVQVKSVNMGSMFKLTYAITLNTVKEEKEFIDELRVRNGNLEISLVRQDFTNEL